MTVPNSFQNRFKEYLDFQSSYEDQLGRYLRSVRCNTTNFLLPLNRLGSKNNSSLTDRSISDLSEFLFDDESVIYWELVGKFGETKGVLSSLGLPNRTVVIEILNNKLDDELKEDLIASVDELARHLCGLFVIDACLFVLHEALESEQLRNWKYHSSGQVEWEPNYDPKRELLLTAGPSISSREVTYAHDAALNGWNRNASKYLDLFESQFASYLGARFAIATSSCTGALQIALLSVDVGPGDEVIVPDLTWVATANAVRYTGAKPVFADVNVNDWTMDITSLRSLVSQKTKAIMPVHMYGHPANMTAIMEIANEFGIPVIEDAAPAIGATWRGKKCGTFGDFAAFSFQGAKLLVTGEGGMLVTDNEELYLRARKIWDQGRNPTRAFWIDSQGVKFKMSNVQAAIGLGQLERVDELIDLKRRIFSWYEEILGDCSQISLNKEVEDAKSIYWMSSLMLGGDTKIERDDLIAALRQLNIDSRPVFPAISQYPIWEKQHDPRPNALSIGRRAMNLPSGVKLTRDQVQYVAHSVRTLVDKTNN